MARRIFLMPQHILKIIGLSLIMMAASAHAQNYDGDWAVTRTGSSCSPKSPITVTIKDNQFSGSYVGGTGNHTITGELGADGKFTFEAKSPGDRVRFRGSLTTGKGFWAASHCKGRLKIFQ